MKLFSSNTWPSSKAKPKVIIKLKVRINNYVFIEIIIVFIEFRKNLLFVINY